jgi:hypothetical protein
MKTNMISYAATFHAVPITYQNARKSYIVFLPVRRGFFPPAALCVVCAPAQFSLMDLCQCSLQSMFKYDDTLIFLIHGVFYCLKDG